MVLAVLVADGALLGNEVVALAFVANVLLARLRDGIVALLLLLEKVLVLALEALLAIPILLVLARAVIVKVALGEANVVVFVLSIAVTATTRSNAIVINSSPITSLLLPSYAIPRPSPISPAYSSPSSVKVVTNSSNKTT